MKAENLSQHSRSRLIRESKREYAFVDPLNDKSHEHREAHNRIVEECLASIWLSDVSGRYKPIKNGRNDSATLA